MNDVRPADCVCGLSGHCHACLAAGRRCMRGTCSCICSDGRPCAGHKPAPRAPAMPLPELEDGPDPLVPVTDDCVKALAAPDAPEQDLEAALRASLAVPRLRWTSLPAVKHAQVRDLSIELPELRAPRASDLDAHERAFVTRRASRRSMRGAA